VIHRDIKPLNVLVTGDGTPNCWTRIAKLIDPYQSPSDQVLIPAVNTCSPRLRSPEQLMAAGFNATDVYALGVLLFELLTGELPFAGSRSELMAQARAICEEEPEKPSEVCLRTHHCRPAKRAESAEIWTASFSKPCAKSPSSAIPARRSFCPNSIAISRASR